MKMENETEKEIEDIRKFLKGWKIDHNQTLTKNIHYNYAAWVIHSLGHHIIHFQNAQPWLHYYVVHTANMLKIALTEEDWQKMIKALKYLSTEGFAGGYRQLPHLAPTYAAFLAII